MSASLYPPKHKSSPKPGASYLKHVGFLGAAAPGVKGLGTVSFAECEGLITLETHRENAMNEAEFAEAQADIERRRQELDEREQRVNAQAAENAAAAAQVRHDANVAFADLRGEAAPPGRARTD